MKLFKNSKLLFILFATILLWNLNSCNDPIAEELAEEDVILKSGKSEKIGYIVQLNDVDLNNELGKIKGYEKKGLAVKTTAAKILKRSGIADGEVEFAYSTALKGFSVKIPPGQLKKLQSDPSVANVEKDQYTILAKPDKPGKPGGGGNTPPQQTPYGITRVGSVNYTGSNVAWILDTGIDLDHPDLNVDASRSVAFGQKNAEDGHGHGTHVAGTIAAINNTKGVIGVAAGATVIAVRILDRRGRGTTSACIAGIDHVAAYGSPGDVANMSVGYPASTSMDQAVVTAASNGIYFALAAGNDGLPTTSSPQPSPGRVNGKNVWTVSAMDINDDFAYFSNYGNPPVDLCAPGVSVYSCYKGGNYTTMSGTSMATPHVCGVLLVTGGLPNTSGFVSNDPDGKADSIAHL